MNLTFVILAGLGTLLAAKSKEVRTRWIGLGIIAVVVIQRIILNG